VNSTKNLLRVEMKKKNLNMIRIIEGSRRIFWWIRMMFSKTGKRKRERS